MWFPNERNDVNIRPSRPGILSFLGGIIALLFIIWFLMGSLIWFKDNFGIDIRSIIQTLAHILKGFGL